MTRFTVNEPRRTENQGFTLIELLVTIVIIALAGTLIAVAFGNGITVYKRAMEDRAGEQNALIVLEKIERDLRNAFFFSKIKFSGDSKKISFAGDVVAGKVEKKKPAGPGKIIYYFDSVRNALMKEEKDYAQATAEEGNEPPGPPAREMAAVESVALSYFYYDPEAKEYKWRDNWGLDETGEEKKLSPLPLGVRIEIDWKDQGRDRKLTRTVFIPVGG